MRFRTDQRFAASVEDVLALFTDPTLYPSLTDLPKISTTEVLDHEAGPDRVRIRLRQRFTGQLPAAALAMIDPAKLSWVQELTFDLAGASATSVLIADHYADRFSCSGRYAYVAEGQHSTGRHLTGEVKVRVPLVGGKVEGAMVSGLQEHARAEEALVAARLVSG
jgi:hypothetical protein